MPRCTRVATWTVPPLSSPAVARRPLPPAMRMGVATGGSTSCARCVMLLSSRTLTCCNGCLAVLLQGAPLPGGHRHKRVGERRGVLAAPGDCHARRVTAPRACASRHVGSAAQHVRSVGGSRVGAMCCIAAALHAANEPRKLYGCCLAYRSWLRAYAATARRRRPASHAALARGCHA